MLSSSPYPQSKIHTIWFIRSIQSNLYEVPITKDKKAEILQGLINEFKSAKSVAVAKTKGLTVAEGEAFRRKLRSNNVSFKIAKKTLICLAAKEAGYANVDKSILEGSIGLAFGHDEVTAAKLVKQQDKKREKMELVALFLEGQFMSGNGANELADIPGKEELLAKFVGMLQSPLNSFAVMLNSPLSSFARGLSEYAKTGAKTKVAAPAKEVAVEEKAPEEAVEESPSEGKE